MGGQESQCIKDGEDVPVRISFEFPLSQILWESHSKRYKKLARSKKVIDWFKEIWPFLDIENVNSPKYIGSVDPLRLSKTNVYYDDDYKQKIEIEYTFRMLFNNEKPCTSRKKLDNLIKSGINHYMKSGGPDELYKIPNFGSYKIQVSGVYPWEKI